MIKRRSTLIFLILIIAFTILFRFVNLSGNPIGFNDDEAAFGYNAYSILKTGHDEWGRFLPFPVFESFGDWKLVGSLYLTVASQFFFGPTVFATRLPSDVVGVLAVLATYFLAQEIFKKEKNSKSIGLLAALFMAISPWHIIASRNAFESDILILPITLGTFLFLKAMKGKNFSILALAIFALSFYIYRSAWLFIPLFLVSFFLINRNLLNNQLKFAIKSIIFFAIVLLPLLPTALTFKGQSRFLQESFISANAKIGIVNEINEKRGDCFKYTPVVLCKIIYNKYASFSTVYFNNYLENLSTQLYFTKGPENGYQSFSNRALFYSFELPLILIGGAYLIYKRLREGLILLFWILLVPIGASFTGVGNPGRLNIIMPAPQIVEAIGLIALLSINLKPLLKKLLVTCTIIFITFVAARLWIDMFYYYPYISGPYQRYGYQSLFDYISSGKNNYSQIAISRKNDDAKQYIHFLFFEKYDPKTYLNSPQTIRFRGEDGWIRVERIDNLYFYPSSPDIEKLPPKSLLITEEKEFTGFTPLKKISYPNGDTIFEIYDVDAVKFQMQEAILKASLKTSAK